jgi:hypothetical protein
LRRVAKIFDHAGATYLRANRTPDARNLLSSIERSATNPDVRRRATTMLDQTEKTFTFSDIVSPVEKESTERQRPRRLL